MNKIITVLLFVAFILLIYKAYFLKEAPQNLKLERLRKEISDKAEPSVDHSSFELLQQTFRTPQEVTEACNSCHTERYKEVMKSSHWNWDWIPYLVGRGFGGSPSNCLQCHLGDGMTNDPYDMNNARNVHCMVCHNTSQEFADKVLLSKYPYHSMDLANVAKDIGKPNRMNCGSCHIFGGGNNLKHGDLEIAQLAGSRELDVHMGVNGANLTCNECHSAKNHQVLGRLYTRSTRDTLRVTCDQCHTGTPHLDNLINRHTAKVSCQACHIPEYAREDATRMAWYMSTAGNLKDGKAYSERNDDGKVVYNTMNGSYVWAKNLKPDYIWFNGTAKQYRLGDTISDDFVKLNILYGSHNDPKSKIYPIKDHGGDQIYDKKYNWLIQPRVYSEAENDSAFDKHFDWHMAAKFGMGRLGFPYSGEYGFVETHAYRTINHMVAPKEHTIACAECHTRESGRLEKLSGFYLPGRDRNKSLDLTGIILLCIVITSILTHSLMRIIFLKGKPKPAARTVYLYKSFERFWHWAQAGLIIFLALTGFEVHGSITVFGFEEAARLHRSASVLLIVLIIFAIFWHITTGEWRQYIPTLKNLKASIRYYFIDMLRGGRHPFKKTVISKLNPMQRLVYLGFKLIIVPITVVSGILYLTHKTIVLNEIIVVSDFSLENIAFWHTLSAILLIVFLLVHVYMTTTGRTPSSNINAMITGYGEPEEE